MIRALFALFLAIILSPLPATAASPAVAALVGEGMPSSNPSTADSPLLLIAPPALSSVEGSPRPELRRRVAPSSVLVDSAPPESRRVKSLAQVGDEIWAGTTNGLYLYFLKDLENNLIRPFAHIGVESAEAPPRPLTPSPPHPLSPSELYLPGLYVTAILPAGNRVWVGTNRGLAELTREGRVLRTWRKQDGLSDEFVTALAMHGPFLYVGSNGWGIARLNVETYEFDYKVFGASRAANRVNGFATAHGALYAATHAGLRKFNVLTGVWDEIAFTEGLAPPPFVRAALRGDRVWAATAGQGVFRYDPVESRWENYTTLQGLTSDAVRELEVNGQEIIAATDDGVGVYDGIKREWSRRYLNDDRSKQESVNAVIAAGKIWVVGTEESGIRMMDARRARLALGPDAELDDSRALIIPVRSADTMLAAAVKVSGADWDTSAITIRAFDLALGTRNSELGSRLSPLASPHSPLSVVWPGSTRASGFAQIRVTSPDNEAELAVFVDNRKPELAEFDNPRFVNNPVVYLKGRLRDETLKQITALAPAEVVRFNPANGEFELKAVLKEGPAAVTFRAEDRFFNSAEFTQTIELDSTPPRIVIKNVPDRSVLSTLYISGSVDDRHVDTVVVRPEPLNFQGGADSFIVLFDLTEGMNKIEIKARDLAQNQTIEVFTVLYAPLTGLAVSDQRAAPLSTENIMRSILSGYSTIKSSERRAQPLNLYIEETLARTQRFSDISSRHYGSPRFAEMLAQLNDAGSKKGVYRGRRVVIPVMLFPTAPFLRPEPGRSAPLASFREFLVDDQLPPAPDPEKSLVLCRRWLDDHSPAPKHSDLKMLFTRIDSLTADAQTSYIAADTATLARTLRMVDQYSILYQFIERDHQRALIDRIAAKVTRPTAPARIKQIYLLAKKAIDEGNPREADPLLTLLEDWLGKPQK